MVPVNIEYMLGMAEELVDMLKGMHISTYTSKSGNKVINIVDSDNDIIICLAKETDCIYSSNKRVTVYSLDIDTLYKKINSILDSPEYYYLKHS